MLLRRRSLLTALGAAGAVPLLARLAAAQTPAAPAAPSSQDLAALTSERAIGSATAPATVMEFYSMTCPHCAAFAQETFPQVKTQLIDTGKLRYVFRDFPLDQVALTACMVARALPPERYEPFVLSLLASQDRWAYARGVNTTEQLAKMAALAGMPRPVFDATIKDTALRDWVLQQQDAASKQYSVDSTPTFIFNGPKGKDVKQAGEMDFATFTGLVKQVTG
jgi:protein-disulfide isomerase